MTADVDMNVVVTGNGGIVEVQGTAERATFDRAMLDALLDLATAGCAELASLQETALSAPLRSSGSGSGGTFRG